MKSFQKQKLNENFLNEDYYTEMFNKLGFKPSSVSISNTNGCSAYISLNINVIDEGEMYGEVFVFEGKASIKVALYNNPGSMSKARTKLPSMIISPFRKGMLYSYNVFVSQATASAGLTRTATPAAVKTSILFFSRITQPSESPRK